MSEMPVKITREIVLEMQENGHHGLSGIDGNELLQMLYKSWLKMEKRLASVPAIKFLRQ